RAISAPSSTFNEWVASLACAANRFDAPRLRMAFEQAREAHAGQENWKHGFSRAQDRAALLVELGLDSDAVMAGLLHDVPRLEQQDPQWLVAKYGETIAALVRGANRVAALDTTRQPPHEADDAQAEALRKMVLAMARDIRVVFIALVERLITLRAVDQLPREQRHHLARQTLQLHASLANRLGIARLKWELEDLSLRILEPTSYHRIAKQLAARREEREKDIQQLKTK